MEIDGDICQQFYQSKYASAKLPPEISRRHLCQHIAAHPFICALARGYAAG